MTTTEQCALEGLVGPRGKVSREMEFYSEERDRLLEKQSQSSPTTPVQLERIAYCEKENQKRK